MPYKSLSRKREYQRLWRAERRRRWMSRLGGCVNCGDAHDLMMHHLDPNKKVSHKIWSWREDRIAEEVLKCEVLCRRCHQVLHCGKPVRHGTNSGYTHYGCRCRACKDAHAECNRRAG